MIRKINLICHLPLYVQGYREMQGIMNAENPELQMVEDSIEIVKNNMFVLHTDEAGIKRYEDMFGMTPLKDDSLYERQSRVLTQYTNDMTYTMRGLIERMDAICGVGNYTIELIPNEYTIRIELLPNDDYLIGVVSSMLMNMLPANMVYTVTLKFNRHNGLSQYPTYLLEQFTHEELHEEVIDDCISNTCGNIANYATENFESLYCEHILNFGMRKV